MLQHLDFVRKQLKINVAERYHLQTTQATSSIYKEKDIFLDLCVSTYTFECVSVYPCACLCACLCVCVRLCGLSVCLYLCVYVLVCVSV